MSVARGSPNQLTARGRSRTKQLDDVRTSAVQRIRMHAAAGIWTLSLVGAVSACARDGIVEQIGQIQGDGAPLGIQVPDSARLGESVLITLVTYGNGCMSRGDTEISIREDDVEITPYDRRNVGTGTCPTILLEFEHDLTVVFDTAGSKRIRINGRHTGTRDGAPFDEIVQISIPMMVE
jgi:hypothetical protein